MKFVKTRKAPSAPATPDPVALERAVSEGVLISRAAAVVSVANSIVIRALRDDEHFDHERTRGAVRTILGRLAAEQREQNERIGGERAKALKAKGRSRHQHDYRRGDDDTLWFREKTYTAVAERLDELRSDEGFVDGIVAAAVDRAWGDVGAVIVTKVAAVEAVDAAYPDERDQRLRALVDEDIAGLVARGRPDAGAPDPS
jgi:hypothetical protein